MNKSKIKKYREIFSIEILDEALEYWQTNIKEYNGLCMYFNKEVSPNHDTAVWNLLHDMKLLDENNLFHIYLGKQMSCKERVYALRKIKQLLYPKEDE